MNKKYDFMVYVGRFQPAHSAHVKTIQRALDLADNVIVIIGSANQARTIKDPWTWKERADMFSEVFSNETKRLTFVGISNDVNDERWVQSVQDAVTSISEIVKQQSDIKIGIIGHVKDDSSYYLKMFPHWNFEKMDNIGGLNATDIRNQMFKLKQIDEKNIPTSIVEKINQFMTTETFEVLVKEYEFIKSYQSAWSVAPYPPTFITADAVVVQSGHVLLVRRRAAPGYGLMAMPGGFVGQNEPIKDAAIRELREETKLKVPVPVLEGSIKAKEIFDKPDRSLRGRTITQAFLFELAPGPLPKVKGGDDASKAFWMPLGDLRYNQDQFFEDHYQIITAMIGKL